MKNLIKHTQNMNTLHQMWNDSDTVILGVSGGPDSMCLLEIMHQIAQKEKLKLIIAHVNYGLRGQESIKDQLLVESVANDLSLLCEVLHCTHTIGKTENEWRDIRYNFFEKIKVKHHAHKIAIAHNKNDQVETFLLHLLRGSGLGGLVGMRYVSKNDVVRPLLSIERSQILQYCSDHNISYRIDQSNKESIHTRNKIRNQLLPYLEKNYNPQIVTTLSHTAEIVAEDMHALNNHISKYWNISPNNEISFSSKVFCDKNVSAQRHSLLQMIEIITGHTKDIERGMIDELRKLIKSQKNKNQAFHGKDLKMLRKGDRVVLTCV